MSTAIFKDARSVATEGERIYRDRYQQDYEGQFSHQFAAIDIHSGRAFVAPFAEDALDKALASSSDALVHLVQVGEPSAYSMAFFLADGDANLVGQI